jgi:hypothetical protein
VLEEQLVHQLADWRFLGVRDELVVLPLVAERRGTAGGPPELGADRDRDGHTLGDLLPLPLRHRSDHRVEEAASWGGGVDGFLQRDQVRVVLAEDVREVQQLAGVSRKARQLREDDARNVAGGDVPEHALGLGMSHDGLPADRFEVIDLAQLPAFRLGVGAGTLLVVLGTLAAGLVLGRNTDPDADGLSVHIRLR